MWTSLEVDFFGGIFHTRLAVEIVPKALEKSIDETLL